MKICQLLFLINLIFFSCKKTETAPDPSTDIVDKWWCAKSSKNTISSQFFKADGTWEQGSKGGKFNDTGKWAISSNKKKIIISNVFDNNKKAKTGWEYDIETSTTTSLVMNWTAFSIKMDMTPCI